MTRKPFFHSAPLAAMVAAFAFLAFGSSVFAAKDFYKWEDENGVIHYSAHPPKDRPNTKVRTTNIYGEAAPQGEKSAAEKAIEEKQMEALPPKDAKRCAAARKNLQTLQAKRRIRIKDGDDYRFLSQEEIDDQLKTVQEIIKQEC